MVMTILIISMSSCENSKKPDEIRKEGVTSVLNSFLNSDSTTIVKYIFKDSIQVNPCNYEILRQASHWLTQKNYARQLSDSLVRIYPEYDFLKIERTYSDEPTNKDFGKLILAKNRLAESYRNLSAMINQYSPKTLKRSIVTFKHPGYAYSEPYYGIFYFNEQDSIRDYIIFDEKQKNEIFGIIANIENGDNPVDASFQAIYTSALNEYKEVLKRQQEIEAYKRNHPITRSFWNAHLGKTSIINTLHLLKQVNFNFRCYSWDQELPGQTIGDYICEDGPYFDGQNWNETRLTFRDKKFKAIEFIYDFRRWQGVKRIFTQETKDMYRSLYRYLDEKYKYFDKDWSSNKCIYSDGKTRVTIEDDGGYTVSLKYENME